MNPVISISVIILIVGYLTLLLSGWTLELRFVSAIFNITGLAICIGSLRYAWAEPDAMASVLSFLVIQNIFLLRHLPWQRSQSSPATAVDSYD